MGGRVGGWAGGQVGRLVNNMEYIGVMSEDYVQPKIGVYVRGLYPGGYVVYNTQEDFVPHSAGVTLEPKVVMYVISRLLTS